jgi:predicted metal-binding protein
MISYVLNNTTSNGTQIINLSMHVIPVEKVLSCTQEEEIRNCCKIGCVNYGKKWSCPPYSKKFSTIVKSKGYDTLIAIVGYINLCDMEYIINPYQQVKAANMILKSKCEKIARDFERELNGYSLLSGSCNLCKPCQKKRSLPCKKPQMVRYSLESTGVNVEDLLEKYCGHKLLWYKKGEKLPYTSVVTAILVDGKMVSSKNTELLVKQYIKEKLINN